MPVWYKDRMEIDERIFEPIEFVDNDHEVVKRAIRFAKRAAQECPDRAAFLQLLVDNMEAEQSYTETATIRREVYITLIRRVIG